MSNVDAASGILYLAEAASERRKPSQLYLMVHANIQKVPESARDVHWRHTARSVGSLAFHIAENYEGPGPKVEIFSTNTPHTAATAQKVAEILRFSHHIEPVLSSLWEGGLNPGGRYLDSDEVHAIRESASRLDTATLVIGQHRVVNEFAHDQFYIPNYSGIVFVENGQTQPVADGYEW